MHRTIAAAVLLFIWLSAAESASAQSALRRLADMVRAQRAAAEAGAEALAPEGRVEEPTPAARSTADDAAGKPGYLGIVADDRQDRGRGVRILQVLPGGPADKAGLKAEDLITSLGGIRMRQMEEVVAVLQQMRPGDVLDVEILRGDSRRQVRVTFGHRPPLRMPHTEPALELREPTEIEPVPLELVPATPQVPLAPSRPADVQALIETLQQRIEELEQRVGQLERALLRQR